MPYVVDNAADSTAVTYPSRAKPQKGDFAAMVTGADGYGVVSGAGVTYGGSGRNLTIASGVVRIDGTDYTMAGGTLTPAAGDGSNPRWDLIVAGVGTGVATAAVVAGTAAATPVFPSVSSTQVLLAAIWVPTSASTLAAENIQDKSVAVVANEWVLAPAPTGGDDASMLSAYFTAWAGKQIQMREGTYSQAGTFYTVPANTTIRGWGSRDTIIQKRAGTHTTATIFNMSDGVRLQNLVLDDNKANITISPAPGNLDADAIVVTTTGVDSIRIEDVWFKDAEYSGIWGGVTDYIIDNCDFTSPGRMGISMNGGCHRGVINNNRVTTPGLKAITFADEGGTVTNDYVRITNNYVDMTATSMSGSAEYLGIELQGCMHPVVENNTVLVPTSAPAFPPIGISIAAESHYAKVEKNSVYGFCAIALECANSNGAHFSGNKCSGYSFGLVSSLNDSALTVIDLVVNGNHFENGSTAANSCAIGIECTSGLMSGFVITNNTFYDYGHNGVRLYQNSGATLRDCTVSGNTFTRQFWIRSGGDEGMRALRVEGGSGHVITGNTVVSLPDASSPSTSGQIISFVGGVTIERIIFSNNRLNGVAPSGATEASCVDMNGAVDGCIFNGNAIQSYSTNFINAYGTAGTIPNYYAFNLDDGKAYTGIKASDYVIRFEDAMVAAGRTLRRVEDFAGGITTATTTATGTIGELGWNLGGAGTSTYNVTAGTAGKPYQAQLASGATNGNVGLMHLGHTTTTTGAIVAADNWDVTFSVLPVSLTTRAFRVGVGNALTTNPPTDGVWIEKETGDTQWFGEAKTGGSSGRTASLGSVSTANWVKLRVRRVNSTTVGFSLDGGTELTLTANIPTSGMQPFLQAVNVTAGAAATLSMEYVDIRVATLSR